MYAALAVIVIAIGALIGGITALVRRARRGNRSPQ
jgi:hypothetical protein